MGFQPNSQSVSVLKTALISTVVAVSLGACSQLNRIGANVGLSYVEHHLAPPILTVDDPYIACESSTALAPLIVAAESFGSNVGKVGALIYTSSALCADVKSVDQELRYLRAADAGNVAEAQDARIAQKDWAALAAARQYKAYQLYVQEIEARQRMRVGDDCPKLRTDMDKTIYMLAMLSGLLAIPSDVNSGNQVGVPKDVAAKVERAMTCLDNTQFWGAPLSVRAAIWDLLPGMKEGKPDPFVVMKEQTKLGEAQGVRLPHAIYAIAAVSSGDEALIRDAIKTYGATVGKTQVNEKFRLIDTIAGQIVTNVADAYWSKNTGHRAPIEDGLTIFWDEAAAAGESDLDIDLGDIL